nr:MAG TPA: hypothetical protein [Caudoviricetes sp.]
MAFVLQSLSLPWVNSFLFFFGIFKPSCWRRLF